MGQCEDDIKIPFHLLISVCLWYLLKVQQESELSYQLDSFSRNIVIKSIHIVYSTVVSKTYQVTTHVIRSYVFRY